MYLKIIKKFKIFVLISSLFFIFEGKGILENNWAASYLTSPITFSDAVCAEISFLADISITQQLPLSFFTEKEASFSQLNIPQTWSQVAKYVFYKSHNIDKYILLSKACTFIKENNETFYNNLARTNSCWKFFKYIKISPYSASLHFYKGIIEAFTNWAQLTNEIYLTIDEPEAYSSSFSKTENLCKKVSFYKCISSLINTKDQLEQIKSPENFEPVSMVLADIEKLEETFSPDLKVVENIDLQKVIQKLFTVNASPNKLALFFNEQFSDFPFLTLFYSKYIPSAKSHPEQFNISSSTNIKQNIVFKYFLIYYVTYYIINYHHEHSNSVIIALYFLDCSLLFKKNILFTHFLCLLLYKKQQSIPNFLNLLKSCNYYLLTNAARYENIEAINTLLTFFPFLLEFEAQKNKRDIITEAIFQGKDNIVRIYLPYVNLAYFLKLSKQQQNNFLFNVLGRYYKKYMSDILFWYLSYIEFPQINIFFKLAEDNNTRLLLKIIKDIKEILKNKSVVETNNLIKKRVQLLLTEKGEISESPIHIFIKNNNIKAIEAILSLDFLDLCFILTSGIQLAIKNNHLKIAALLMKNKHLSYLSQETIDSALIKAAEARYYPLVSLMLSKGASPYARNPYTNKTVIDFALINQDSSLAKRIYKYCKNTLPNDIAFEFNKIIKKPATRNQRNLKLQPYLATSYLRSTIPSLLNSASFEELGKLLKSAGSFFPMAELNLRKLESYLEKALIENAPPEIIENFVQSSGIKIDYVNPSTLQSYIHLITLYTKPTTRQLQYLDLFIKYGANLNQQDKQGKTPLHLAVQKENIDVCKKLLFNGARPDLKDKKGETPYSLAQREPKSKIAKFFKYYKQNRLLEFEDKYNSTK